MSNWFCHPDSQHAQFGTSQNGHCNVPTKSTDNPGMLLYLIAAATFVLGLFIRHSFHLCHSTFVQHLADGSRHKDRIEEPFQMLISKGWKTSGFNGIAPERNEMNVGYA